MIPPDDITPEQVAEYLGVCDRTFEMPRSEHFYANSPSALPRHAWYYLELGRRPSPLSREGVQDLLRWVESQRRIAERCFPQDREALNGYVRCETWLRLYAHRWATP